MDFLKRNPKIFILSGKARSGKDEVANIIQKYYSNKKCIKISYAYYLKIYAMNISDWDGSEKTKPRELLQNLGIELIKNKIDDNLLIRRVCEDIKVYSYFYDVIIITDARLKKELEIPQKLFENIVTIRINNKRDNGLLNIEKKHLTEIDLDNYYNFDYIVDYADKENQIFKILEEENGKNNCD